jgi:uncharacterized protein YggU (UPF0235/DUF167 family)
MGEPSTRLRLRVSPGARESTVIGRYGDGWKVRVSAAPERGAANDELLRLVAERLSLSRGQVTLVAGHGGRDKVVELRGISAEETERRLDGGKAR